VIAQPAVVVAHGLWMPGSETWLLRRRLAARGMTPYVFRYRTVGEGLAGNARELARFLAVLPEPLIHLVGYSLGGVIAILTLREHHPEHIGRLVCLGSPLNGSATGRALVRLPGGRRVLGRSMLELNDAGGVGPWTGETENGVIAGRLGFGVGRLFGALTGPNDGTVAVGIDAHRVIRASHTSLLFSREAADGCARFLVTGAF